MLTNMTKTCLAISGVMFLSACAGSGSQPPQETHDGLVLQETSKVDQLYMRPEATLEGYSEIGLVPCQVAFRKNWQRDQNNSSIDLGNRVTQSDVDSIKDSLSASCDNQFRSALLADPAYTLVEEFTSGEPVLVLRPAIINLDISAPDTMSAGRNRSYTTSAGQMTLYLELLDGTTGEILARIVDRKRASDYGRMQWTNGVTNKGDADRILKRWAVLLRSALDETMAK